MNLKTEDIAKFGQFLLNRGTRNGKQILPAQYIDRMTMKHINNSGNTKYPRLDDFMSEELPDADKKSDWAQGYGRQFWRCVPEGIYRGDGAFGQLCVVMPQYDAVLAVTAGTGDMQAELNAVGTILCRLLFPDLCRPMKKLMKNVFKAAFSCRGTAFRYRTLSAVLRQDLAAYAKQFRI